MKKIVFFVIMTILVIQLSSFVFAQEGTDVKIFNLEVEKLLNLGSGILAAILFIISLVAYNRTKRKKLFYVSVAFALFAVKSFLLSMEIFFGDIFWVDPISSVLDFGVLLTFFSGMLKN